MGLFILKGKAKVNIKAAHHFYNFHKAPVSHLSQCQSHQQRIPAQMCRASVGFMKLYNKFELSGPQLYCFASHSTFSELQPYQAPVFREKALKSRCTTPAQHQMAWQTHLETS